MDSLDQKHKISCFYQGKILKNVPKRLKMSILTHCGSHFGFLHFSEGHPSFRTFFNFFFENGIKRYQVTNLSEVHDDLKLCPKNNPL